MRKIRTDLLKKSYLYRLICDKQDKPFFSALFDTDFFYYKDLDSNNLFFILYEEEEVEEEDSSEPTLVITTRDRACTILN
jgi:hypothetical protein